MRNYTLVGIGQSVGLMNNHGTSECIQQELVLWIMNFFSKLLRLIPGKPISPLKAETFFNSTHLALNSDLYICSFTTSRDTPNSSSGEVQSLSPLKFSREVEESPLCNADNSPQFYSASSKGGSSKRRPFTPDKSDGSRSYLI